MDAVGNGLPRRVRRVVSRLEEVVCENAALEQIYGVCTRRAQDVAQAIAPLLENQSVEHFVTIMLDVQNHIIGFDETTKGTLTSSLVHPREVFGPAVRLGAAAVIVAHNHPSGDPEPSMADRELTKRLIEAGKLLGIPMVDHVIIGSYGAYRSLREVMEFP